MITSPAAAEYILAGTTSAVVTAIAVDDATLTLSVCPSIMNAETVTLTRAAGATITDQAGNPLAANTALSRHQRGTDHGDGEIRCRPVKRLLSAGA